MLLEKNMIKIKCCTREKFLFLNENNKLNLFMKSFEQITFLKDYFFVEGKIVLAIVNF